VNERTWDLSNALANLASEVQVRERAEEELRNLSVHLMAVQDEERRRIARDLHDSAGQTLAAIKMSLASLRTIGNAVPNLLQFADDLDALSDEALREIRTNRACCIHISSTKQASLLLLNGSSKGFRNAVGFMCSLMFQTTLAGCRAMSILCSSVSCRKR